MRSYRSVCTGSAGFSPGQGMRRIHNDSTMGSSGRASVCGRDSRDLDRILADGLGVQRTIVRRVVTCIPPRREVYRVNQGRMARNSGFLGKIISTILIAVSGKWELNPRPLGPEPSALTRLRYTPNGRILAPFFGSVNDPPRQSPMPPSGRGRPSKVPPDPRRPSGPPGGSPPPEKPEEAFLEKERDSPLSRCPKNPG